MMQQSAAGMLLWHWVGGLPVPMQAITYLCFTMSAAVLLPALICPDLSGLLLSLCLVCSCSCFRPACAVGQSPLQGARRALILCCVQAM